MTTVYPGTLDSWTDKTDGVDIYYAAHVNNLQDAVEAIETELGTDPAGTATDLKTRLSKSLAALGDLQFKAATTLTIASGVITPTQNWHLVETQSSAATDDLDTITAMGEAHLLILRIVADARNVVIKHATGNIACAGGADITLDLTSDLALLLYDDTLDKWLAFGISAAGLLAKANTWTALQYFNYGVRNKYSSVSGDLTLTDAYYMLNVSASGAARTITLPTAASVAGLTFVIRKSDSSANTVTIDGNGAETINGAATKVLSSQYETVTLMSDGTNWMIL